MKELPSALPVKICWLRETPPLYPLFQTESSAGMDLHACIPEPLWMQPMERLLVPTGFSMELPQGYEAQLRPRSGLALRHGITLLNSPGTIDADYRGEIKVLLIHLGQEPFVIQPNERIAQMVVHSFEKVEWHPVVELTPSKRSEQGFGSTGK